MDQQPPVTSQPTSQENVNPAGWMPIPVAMPNCPRGLEYMTAVDQLLVKQKVHLMRLVGYETRNKFEIKNARGQSVYYAVEESTGCTRNCFGRLRQFDLGIYDKFRNEVIHIYRPFKCGCLQSIEVSSPPGNLIGTVDEECTWCTPRLGIKDTNGKVVLRIEAPAFQYCSTRVDFKVLNLAGQEIGRVSKQWSNLGREFFTDADYFGITFPMGLDARIKTVLLGATFLIQIKFYEE